MLRFSTERKQIPYVLGLRFFRLSAAKLVVNITSFNTNSSIGALIDNFLRLACDTDDMWIPNSQNKLSSFFKFLRSRRSFYFVFNLRKKRQCEIIFKCKMFCIYSIVGLNNIHFHFIYGPIKTVYSKWGGLYAVRFSEWHLILSRGSLFCVHWYCALEIQIKCTVLTPD